VSDAIPDLKEVNNDWLIGYFEKYIDVIYFFDEEILNKSHSI